jgi:hypothetical protein
VRENETENSAAMWRSQRQARITSMRHGSTGHHRFWPLIYPALLTSTIGATLGDSSLPVIKNEPDLT